MNTKHAHVRAVLVLLACAFLTACDSGSSSSDYAKVVAENQRLASRNEDLQKQVADLKNSQVILGVSTAFATFAAAGAFCVGLAIGIRIRRQHTKDEPRT